MRRRLASLSDTFKQQTLPVRFFIGGIGVTIYMGYVIVMAEILGAAGVN